MTWDRCTGKPTLALALALVVLGAEVSGCGDSTPSQSAGSSSAKQPAPPLNASNCPFPELPEGLAGGTPIVIGTGQPESCTIAALHSALEQGGKISFNCGSDLLKIPVDHTLVVRDGTWIDGGSRVALDGGDTIRILRTETKATAVIEGLFFWHGSAKTVKGQDTENGSGGAIYRGWQSNVLVRSCTFEGNSADAGTGAGGGAIGTASSGWLTIYNSTFIKNRSPWGGAVYSVLSDLTVTDSWFTANEATTSDGGAIYTDGAFVAPKEEHGAVGGKIALCGTQFSKNTAPKSAAAGFLFAYGKDQLSINRCEFRENQVTTADPGLGGALRIDALASVENSLFADNHCVGQGGALWMGRGPAVFQNVTFSGNSADLWGGAISYGDKPVTLNNCTVARSRSGKGADALFGNAGVLVAHNTLFAQNGEKADAKRHCSSAIGGDHNLAFPAEANDACGPSLIHEDPQIADALANLKVGSASGSTWGLSLGEGSAALNAGAQCPATDQRGEPRPAEGCDLGAMEF